MKISDNANFFIIKAFFTYMVINIPRKITQRINGWLNTQLSFTVLNLLFVTIITIICKIYIATNSLKPTVFFYIH